MTVTRRLIERARSISFEALPDDVVTVAKTCILDWLGCALAGAREPLTDILAEEAATNGSCTLIGRNARTSPQWAALVNGAAAHALDYDDTHLLLMGHPSAPVVPAILALAQTRRTNGRDFLTAFVSGVEVECRLGALVGGSHYGAGWHATATLGAFGAAAACARLVDLDEERFAHAFGLAGVQASGLKSVFGTMSKPFQVGRAAENGVVAAQLAAKGFTSAPDVLDVDQGFAATYTTTWDPAALDAIGDRYLVRDTVFKYHASCYLTHSAIEAALAQKVDAGTVENIEVHVPRGHLSVCNILEPKTGLEGKFSLRGTVAMAVLGDDTADPAAFTDERMQAREFISLRDKIAVQASPDMRGTETRVEVKTTDGAHGSETADVGVPADDVGRQWDKLSTKFVRLASPVIGDDRAWRVQESVAHLDELEDVSRVAAP